MIILTILKWIGIVLLVLLLLLLFLFLLAVIYPITYKIKIDDMNVWVNFSYLFHLVRGHFTYVDGELDYCAKLAFKRIIYKESDSDEKEKIKTKQKSNESKNQKAAKVDEKQKNPYDEEVFDGHKESDKGKDFRTEEKPDGEKFDEYTRNESDSGKNIKKSGSKGSAEHRQESRKSPFETVKGYVIKIRRSIIDKFEKLKTGFFNYTDDCAKATYAHVLSELVVFLKHIRPRFGYLEFTLGFDDPSYSGLALAVYSLIYPKVHKRLKFNADFENAGYSGKGTVKGILQLWLVLLIAARLFFDKNLRKFLDRR